MQKALFEGCAPDRQWLAARPTGVMDGQRRGIQALCQQVAERRLANGGSVHHRETREAFEAAYIAPMQTRALHLAAIERHSLPGMACQGTQTR